MMRAVRVRASVVVVILLVAGFAADRLRSAARACAPSRVDAVLQPPVIPAPALRVLALGFQSTAADASYLDAIQIFGDDKTIFGTLPVKERRSRAEARLLLDTTTLDPKFDYAYIFAAVSLPIPWSDGTTHNADFAIDLLRKGVGAVPDDWRIPFYLGYLLSTTTGDYAGAARAMAEAARRPGLPGEAHRPPYLPFLAMRLAAQGGSIQTGLMLARSMLANAQTKDERDRVEERIRLLHMERDLRQIEAAARRYRARAGRFPPSLEALVASGDLARIPPEPHGGRYLLDPETGVAHSTAAHRLRLFVHPADQGGTQGAAGQPETVKR